MKSAWILQQGVRVARIAATANGYRIEQSDGLGAPPEFPGLLATTIPWSALPLDYSEAAFPRFFLNMLPEGSRLSALMESSHVSNDDPLGLLLATQGEPPGDVSLESEEPRPNPSSGDAQLENLLSSADFAWPDLNRQLLAKASIDSISGVQDKISRGSLTFRLTGSRAAKILKIPTERFPRIAENEFFVLSLAKKCGFDVPRLELVPDVNGLKAFGIERFDRVTHHGIVRERFHLEDGCQLMNLSPSRKYEVRLQDLTAKMLEWASSVPQTLEQVCALIAFSYIIGNADMHAKNISLIWRRGICDLSPAYDLLTTLPYRDHPQQMALQLYGRDNRLRLRDVLDLARNNDVRTEALAMALRKRLAPIPREIQNFGVVGFDEKTTEYVIGQVLRRYESFFAPD
ncbi:MAG: HipA domain-containing protein [Armatimonadetes bacterium]|nr:HipA domain-containing protein [Armatimonadota bacterium]